MTSFLSLQLTATVPSDDKEALFHVNNIRFGGAGKNVLCVSCFSSDKCATESSVNTGYRTDIEKSYTPQFIKSENITAFMTVIKFSRL